MHVGKGRKKDIVDAKIWGKVSTLHGVYGKTPASLHHYIAVPVFNDRPAFQKLLLLGALKNNKTKPI